jgi:biopolymer transport protein ExbD
MALAPSKSRNLLKKPPKEPNLIPIMNLFIVIIPMLMTIMVSVHLAMIEINLPTDVGGGGGDEEQLEEPEELPAVITLALYPDRFEIKVEDEKDVNKIPALDTTTIPAIYDFAALDELMSTLKEDHEKQETIELLPDNAVKFDTLLRSIDICKSNGFSNIKYLTASTKYFKQQ